MSLASLPHKIPFNLGGVVYPTEIRAWGFTGVLPKGLPFNLSARTEEVEIPYGSLGFQLICRSHVDFQTELLRTSDFTGLTFSKELNALGMGAFTLNVDEPVFLRSISNAARLEDLFDYENLWEVAFDGQPVFQMLGTAISDSSVVENESPSVSVNGTGIGHVLNWASVYPPGYPEVTNKLGLFTDEISGDVFDVITWENTVLNSVVSISSNGQKQQALADIEQLTSDKTNLQSQLTSDNASYVSEKASYTSVMKQTGPVATAKQKAEAKKQLDAAQAEVTKTTAELARVTALLTKAQAISTAAGPLLDDTTFGHIKVTSNGSDQPTYIYSGFYDLEDSGIAAGVDVAPQGAGGGVARTVFGIRTDETTANYARFYTNKSSGNRRLVAEVVSNSTVSGINDWDYDPVAQRYWRIREDNGFVIFETSANDTTWVERLRAPYYFDPSRVQFYFGTELIGNSGIAPPLSSYLYSINSSALPVTQGAVGRFLDLLSDSQARGTIPYVAPTFTETEDSRGLAWVGKPGINIEEGTKLLPALQTVANLQQADWIMDVDFKLHLYQRTKEDVTIPPVYFTRDDVVFVESVSQLSKGRTINRENITNAIVGKNSVGQYAEISDADSIEKFSRREAFISAGSVGDLPNLAAVLDANLEELKDQQSSWKIVVPSDQPGRRVFKDYDVGNWVRVETVNSQSSVTVTQWRVVGIAISITEDGEARVELTLQSRIQLLIERLKALVEGGSTSAGSSSSVSLGSQVSAAVLLEQATLAGLKDVFVPSPIEGDVLTYQNGFWVPQAPGDKTIPDIPNITSALTNVYYPADGVSVRAQAEVKWTLPDNTDGSFITDGHHFELRYRPDITADYSSTWEEASDFVWDELYTWAQPTIPPISNSGWQVIYVGWDEQSTFIQELTPGVDYQIQIRAVDSSTPQHFSEWSDIVTFSAEQDTIAPPKPAPPVVASSLLSLQVTHYLGISTGGTFNLPPDMAYLEIHVGPASFYPDESTRVGKIIADSGMIRSGTPVIQTFNVDKTEDVFVRVIAVDRAGNRSAPSNAVTSTITLIDDAHVSDLTASKITAGTITSSIILGGVIKTAESGARAEMNFEGFRIFSEDDDPTVSLLGNPSTNGNFLLIKDLEDPTITLAGIDGLGRGSFQDVSVVNDVTINGEKLIADIIDPRAKGVIAIGTYSSDPFIGGGAAVERGFLEISFIAEESRTYMICAVTEFESTNAGDERMIMRLRDGGDQSPTLAMPWIQQSISSLSSSAAGANSAAQIIYSGTFTPGLHRILWSFTGQLGNCTVNAPGGLEVQSTSLIWVEDVGLPQTDTVIINDAGVPASSGPTTPTTSPTIPKVTYTRTYACTWSGTYRSNGDYSSSHGSQMVHGDSGADSWLNDARSLCGFNYAQIMSDLKGATIKSCYITLYANHWYWNDGGTARIGTHNYTGRPGSWAGSRVHEQRISSSDWPKPGKRKVSLGTTIGNEFKSGASKGIALGPTTGTKTQYGKFNGNGQSNEPVLTIVYVK